MTTDETMTIYRDAAQSAAHFTYGYDRRPATIREMVKRGSTLQSYIVAVGGYKLVITYADSLLVSIRPKAASAGRGEIIIDHAAGTSMSLAIEEGPFQGVSYFWDTYGSYRLQASLQVAILAALAARSNKETLYAALGKSGFCAICGAGLSDELSMARGIGPECFKTVYKNVALQYVQKKRVEKNDSLFASQAV